MVVDSPGKLLTQDRTTTTLDPSPPCTYGGVTLPQSRHTTNKYPKQPFKWGLLVQPTLWAQSNIMDLGPPETCEGSLKGYVTGMDTAHTEGSTGPATVSTSTQRDPFQKPKCSAGLDHQYSAVQELYPSPSYPLSWLRKRAIPHHLLSDHTKVPITTP